MQKTWWVFFGCWIASCLLNAKVAYPEVLATMAGLDLLCIAGFVLILWGNAFRNTRLVLGSVFVTMLACHAIWASLLHFELAPHITSTNYYHQLSLNILTALSYMVIGGRCVPLVLGALRDSGVFNLQRVRAAGGGK